MGYVFYDNYIATDYIGNSLRENSISKCFIHIYIRFMLLEP